VWWLVLIQKTIKNYFAPTVLGNPYGKPDDYVDVAESWAQFLGTNYTLRRYPGSQGMMSASVQGSPNAAFNTAYSSTAGSYYPMETLLENEYWYFAYRWMPYGCFHDLMDDTNRSPNNPDEKWDNIQGVSIQQLFNAHGSNITSMPLYRFSFTNQNPGLNRTDVNDIFENHAVDICR
jgi:hypothetical protein